jgi:hypothetical protein
LDQRTGASQRGALFTQTAFQEHADKVTYLVQFATPGTYYLYMRFTMFENGLNTAHYLNEDSFFVPPDFDKDPQTDWPLPRGGYVEGCCDVSGFLYIPDGSPDRINHTVEDDAGKAFWEGNFHWNQLFVSQFLGGIHTNLDGSPRAGSVFHYVVTPAMVGVPQNCTIASREPGITPDLFLFSTHTNLLNDYTQDQLDQMILQPKLYITASGGNVTISWPTTASGYDLDSTSSLSVPSWTPVSAAATIVGTRYNLTMAPAGTKYYRLRQR